MHGSVRAEQRKTILVIFYLLCRNIPALHGVALRAIGAHLPLVNVRVALFAILANIGEHGLDVTPNAFDFFVQAAQRITCFVVIEFRNRANGLPAGGGVTVLTRNCQGAVRTPSVAPLTGRKRSTGDRPRQQRQPAKDFNPLRRKRPLDLRTC